MTERQIECFLSLARTLNFSQTAKELYLSQPAVSQLIHALEDDLGVPLFRRGRRGVTLTVAGRTFYGEAEDYLHYSRTLVQRVRQKADAYTHRVDISYGVRLRMLPDILHEFHLRYPQTLVNLYAGTSMNSARHLESGRCDLVVEFADQSLPRQELFTPLYTGGFICVVAQDSPLAARPQISVQDLRGQVLFTLQDTLTNTALRRLNNYLYEHQNARAVYPVSEFGEAAILAEAGFGVAVIPRVYTTPHAGAVHIPFAYFEDYCLGLRRRADATPQVCAFCQVAEQLCRQDAGAPLL